MAQSFQVQSHESLIHYCQTNWITLEKVFNDQITKKDAPTPRTIKVTTPSKNDKLLYIVLNSRVRVNYYEHYIFSDGC